MYLVIYFFIYLNWADDPTTKWGKFIGFALSIGSVVYIGMRILVGGFGTLP